MQTSNSLLFGPQLPGQFGNFEPMFDPTMMAMLLDQLTQGQEAQGPKGRPGDGARMQQHYPQVSNSSTKETRNGVQASGWDAAWGEEDDEESPAPYQSTGFSIPERGAARRYPAFQEMKDFARDMGARDDSMVGPESTPWEDESNLGRLDAMTHLAGRDLAEAVLQASPEQRDQITESEARLEEQLRDEEEMGSPVPMSRQRMMYAQNMDDLYGQGLVGDEIGQRNREYMQLLETRDRSAIDMGLKYGYGPPVGADPLQVEESAFQPRSRQSAPEPRAETRRSTSSQPAESRGGVQEVKLDKWGEGKVSSTWAALRSAGWSDKEIIENKLVDRVGEMNGLENPAKVQAGSTLKIPTRPGQSEREQTGPLYEADGGPAHRVPSWERQESSSPDAGRRTQSSGQQSGQTRPTGQTQPTGQTGTTGQTQPTGQTRPTGESQPAPEEPRRPPYDPSKDATDLYESMNGGLLGWGTDEDKLFHALEGKTPEQVSAIRTLYKDHYNRDLDADIKGDLSGKQLDRANALLEGNSAAADADRLNHAMKGGFLGIGTDEKAVFETLEGKSPEQRQAIIDEYSRRNNGADLRKEITGELSGAELDRANALLDGNQAKADAASMRQAMKGGFLGMGTDEDTLYRTLDGKSAEEREAIMREYGATYQDGDKPADLRSDLKGELSGAELDRANALLDGDHAAADAAALNHAMKGGFLGMGTDEDTIYKTFEGKSEDERRAIVAAYDKYGSLDTHLNEELSGNDLEHAQKLVTNGEINDVDRLRYAMEGMGTDEEAVHGVLEGKSKDEIDSLRADYLATTGRTLDHDLEGDLSGRELFDAQMSMKGRPESAEEAVQRQNERWEYERGEGNNVGNFFVDLFSDKGQLLDRNTSRMNEQLDRVEQLRSEGRMDEAREAEQRLSQLVDYTHDDVSSYREAKDSAADAAGTVAATAASVAVVVGTAGTATPLVVAGLAAGAGAGAKVLTKGAIEGRGYGWEEGLTDAGTGAIDGLSTAVGAKAGQVAASSVGKAMAARAEATLAREAAARAATTGAEVAATTTTEAAATGTHASLSMGQRVMMGAAEGAVDGTVGGAAGGAGYTALDENTWKDGMLTGLERMAEGTAMGAGMGAVAGGVIGGGMPVAGSGLAKGRELAGDAATWTRGRMADAGDMLRDGTGRLRQAGSDALEHARNLKANLPDGGEVVGRIKKAGQDFYDYGMDGGYIGKKLKAGRAGGEAAEEVVGPQGGPKAENLVDDAAPTGGGRVEAGGGVADEVGPAPQPETPPVTPPSEPRPESVLDRIKRAGQEFYDNGMEGGIIGKRLKGAGRQGAEDVVPTPPKPDAPTPPAPDAPKPGKIKQFYDYGMNGGLVGNWLKKQDLGNLSNVGGKLVDHGRQILDDVGKAGKQFYDFGMEGGMVGKLRRAGEEVPAGAGGATPPPLPKEGGAPHPLPKEGGELPPPLPKEGGELPPPLPKEGGELPPPLPKEGGELPPPLPKEGGELPPPLPKEGGELPPPLPKEGGEVPPPLPRQNADEVAAAFRKRVDQFPDRPMLARFREQASFNQMSPEQQSTVLELAARHKPEQPTGLMARLFRGSSEQTSAMEDSLQKLMRDGRLTNTDVNGVTLLDNLNQLDQAPKMYHRGLNARALSEEVAATAANPARVIKQGQRGTCSATTVQYIHAYKNPSDYARVMRELTTEGEATLASGKKMNFNRTALGPDNSGRREADKIYQAAAMNQPSGRYDNWAVNPMDGSKGGHVNADGSFDYDGLTSKQGNELLSDIMGEKYSDVGYIGGAGDSPANRARFRQKMEEMMAQGEPMHVGLTWGEVGHGGHAVSVEGMDDQFVYIRNPHGENASTNLEAGPRIRRENLSYARDGRQRITHDEFFGRLQSYQSRPTTVREKDFLRIGEAYGATPNPGDVIDDPATTARFKRFFPDATIEHMDLEGLKTFYEGFDQRLHRAGMEAAPMGKGNYREAMAELNEYMKNYGYPDGDFSQRGFAIG